MPCKNLRVRRVLLYYAPYFFYGDDAIVLLYYYRMNFTRTRCYFFSLLIAFLLMPHIVFAATAKKELTPAQMIGRILIQTESYGRAWYADPITNQRFYIRNGAEAFNFFKTRAQGISNSDIKKIPSARGQATNKKLVSQFRGEILLQVENKGLMWWVNPVDGIRYPIKDSVTAYELMKKFGTPVKNTELKKIAMNDKQIVQDTTFNDVAYVGWNGSEYFGGYNADELLPPASMTKLMTAMVLLDHAPNWQKPITITKDILRYPLEYVGDDATSEVALAEGDTMTFYDLWVAMLVSSSNQAAAALVGASGIPQADFIRMMNDKAVMLGLTKTIFYDVAGLDSHNVTTAKEWARLAAAAFAMPKIADTTVTSSYTINATDKAGTPKSIKAVNRNYSVLAFGPDAVKTGYLIEAQRTVCLHKDDETIVVMHARSMKERNAAITKLLGL